MDGYCEFNGICQPVPAGYFSPKNTSVCFKCPGTTLGNVLLLVTIKNSRKINQVRIQIIFIDIIEVFAQQLMLLIEIRKQK